MRSYRTIKPIKYSRSWTIKEVKNALKALKILQKELLQATFAVIREDLGRKLSFEVTITSEIFKNDTKTEELNAKTNQR